MTIQSIHNSVELMELMDLIEYGKDEILHP